MSIVHWQAFLRPSGGVPQLHRDFAQGNRPATSHAIVVQTPHVYTHTGMAVLAVLVQLYDQHGRSAVEGATLTLTASLAGAPDLQLHSYTTVGPSGDKHTRRYSAAVPASWFAAATVAGVIASVAAMKHAKWSILC